MIWGFISSNILHYLCPNMMGIRSEDAIPAKRYYIIYQNLFSLKYVNFVIPSKVPRNPPGCFRSFFLFLKLPLLFEISNKTFLSFEYSLLILLFWLFFLEVRHWTEHCELIQIKHLCLRDLNNLLIEIGHPVDFFWGHWLTLTWTDIFLWTSTFFFKWLFHWSTDVVWSLKTVLSRFFFFQFQNNIIILSFFFWVE